MTVTFQAFKPGLLLGEGPERAGRVEVADIGLGAGVAEVCTTWLVTDPDVAERTAPPGPATATNGRRRCWRSPGRPG